MKRHLSQMEGGVSRGLTLIELLVAMSIFTVLGLFLFTLTRSSLGIYRMAQGSGEMYDRYDRAMDVIVDDLRCVWIGDPGGPGMKVEFLCSHDRRHVPAQGVVQTEGDRRAHTYATGDPRSFLLRFVRTYPGGELRDTVGRFAGTYGNATAYIDGVDDLKESRAAELRGKSPAERVDATSTPVGLRAPGGLMEVMYFVHAGPYDRPGSYTLYRAVRSPVGGPGSFFDPGTPGAMSPEWIERHASPVVSGVAFFGMLFWGQNTRQWNTETVLDGAGKRTEDSTGNDWGELWWDSTRSREARFGLHRGEASLSAYEDDVFPSRVRVVMTLAKDGDDVHDALLLGDVKAGNKDLRINQSDLFRGADEGVRFLKIGEEWMEVASAEGRRLRVKRGRRASLAQRHRDGDGVVVGRNFEVVVDVPAHRSWFRGPGEKR